MSTYVDAQQQQRETEQIIGVVTGIVQKGPDKWQAVVMPDNAQYTKNLWTKDVHVVQYLTSQIGNRIAFLCNVSHWTNAQQQPVRSLWIDQVGSPMVGSPALAGPQPTAQPVVAQPVAPPQAPQQNAVVHPQAQAMGAQAAQQAPATPQNSRWLAEREYERPFIHRQAASKVAVHLLGYLSEEERTLSNLLVISERLVAYYNQGLAQVETVEQLMQRAMPQGMGEYDSAAAQGTGYANTPAADDDIPF